MGYARVELNDGDNASDSLVEEEASLFLLEDFDNHKVDAAQGIGDSS
jgi:hypothetical protein